VAASRSHRDERTDAFIARMGPTEPMSLGSSLKFCRLAEGAADLYPRFGDVNAWDAAAGHAILSAAGGNIMRLDGSPLRYGERTDNFLIHGFVAYASEAAATAARSTLR
jgi:3'(2'), 5'-bisphosphate nucleotidase